MADLSVGTRGTLRITDDGSTVAFYVLCGDPATRVGSYNWYGTVNGVGVGGTVNLPAGFGSRLLGSWSVGYSQTVTLGQQATGTQGLGGAAGFSVGIGRATVPPAPYPYPPNQITDTSVRFQFAGQGDGGSGIWGWIAQCATDPGFTQNMREAPSGGTSTFGDLTPGVTYYFRARGDNAVGRGHWSNVVSARTLQQPAAPTGESTAPGRLRVSWVAPPGNLVSNVSGWDLEHADNDAMTDAKLLQLSASASPYTIDGLPPGQQVRARVRARYTDALGPWSPIATVALLSGVYASDGEDLNPGGMHASNGARLAVAQVLFSDGTELRPAL